MSKPRDPISGTAAALRASSKRQTVPQLRALLSGLWSHYQHLGALFEQAKRERDDWKDTAEVRKNETLTIIMSKATEVNRLLDEIDDLRGKIKTA